MIGCAVYFYEPKIGVLQANCKCASLWAERELREKKIDNPLKVLRKTGCNFYSTYRRPRNWYISGYMYWCENHQYSLSFTEHLLHITKLKAEFNKLEGFLVDHSTPTTKERPYPEIRRPDMYDYHTWIDPWLATQMMLGEKGRNIKINWIDTDNTSALNKLVKVFKGATVDNSKYNVSSGNKPIETKKTKALINRLDNWSKNINTV